MPARSLLLLMGLLAAAGEAHAACAGPVGSAGDVRYATNFGTLAFCNGTDWISMAGWGTSGSGGATLLNELTDVDTTGAANGKVLSYNGSTWVVSDSTVTDARIGTLAAGKWCTSNGTIISCTVDAPLTTSATLYDLSDVDTTGAATGNVLAFNGTSWVVSNSASGSATPAGSANDVQYNDGTNLAADTGNFTYSSGVLKAPTISGTTHNGYYASFTTASVGSLGVDTINASGLITTTAGLNTAGTVSATAVSATYISSTYVQIQSASTVLSCGSALTGTIRYTSGTVQVCDGSNWGNVGIGVPTGSIMAFAASTCPSGWTEYTPARGRFLRGIDNGAGNDPSGTRVAGNTQADALQNITGSFSMRTINGSTALMSPDGAFYENGTGSSAAGVAITSNDPRTAYGFDASRVARTSNETRPKNVAVTFCQYAGYESQVATGITTLDGLSDVNTSGVSDGQALVYSGGTWIASTTSGGSAVTAGSTGDIQFNSSGALAADTGNFTYASGVLKAPTVSGTNAVNSAYVSGTRVWGSWVSGTFVYANHLSATTASIGSLGVGTINASGDITTTGVISASGLVVGANSPAATGAVRFNAASNTLQVFAGGWRSLSSSTTAGTSTAASSTGAIQFNSGNSFAGDTSNLFWDDANNRLGIGTTAPGSPLHVSRTSGGALATFSTTSPSTNTWISVANGLSGGTFGVDVDNVTYSYSSNAYKIFTGGASERLRVKSSGDVGIGTQSPTASLQVSGSFIVSTSAQTTTPSLYVGTDGNVGVGLSDPDALLEVNGVLGMFKVSGSLGNMIVQGNGATIELTRPGANYVRASNAAGALVFDTGGNNQRMFIDAIGRVGISTSLPKASLDVVGTISTSNAIQVGQSTLSCSTAISGSIRYETTSDTLQICTSAGWKSLTSSTVAAATVDGAGSANHVAYWSDVNTLTYDSSQLYWDATNNRLGIGVSAPGAALDVSSGAVRFGGTGTSSIELGVNSVGDQYSYIDLVGDDTYTDHGLRVMRGNTGANTDSYITHRGTGGLAITAQEAGHIRFSTTNAERMRILSGGNIGIGTTAPGVSLEVSATSDGLRLSKIGGGTNPYMSWYNNGARQAYMGYGTAGTDFDITSENATRLDITGANGVAFNATAGNITANDLFLMAAHAKMSGATSNSIAWGTAGTAAPSAGSVGMKLQLYGATQNVMATNDYALGIESSNLWMNTGEGIKLYSGSALKAEMQSTGTVSATAFHASNGDTVAAPGHTWIGDTNTGMFHPVADLVGFSINGTERLRVSSAYISPTATLAMGSYAITMTSGTVIDGGGGWHRTYGNTGWYNGTYGGGWYMTDGTYIRNYGSKETYLNANITAPAFLYSSDLRLKTDIAPITGGLAKLAAIEPITFRFISDTQPREHLGVIAQDVEKVYPQAVYTDEAGYKRVDYPALVPALIAALKELNDRVGELELKLKAANDNSPALKVVPNLDR